MTLQFIYIKLGKDHGIRFNPNKTQLICFGKWGLPSSTSVKITFAGKQLTSLWSVKHLGQLLTDDSEMMLTFRLSQLTL